MIDTWLSAHRCRLGLLGRGLDKARPSRPQGTPGSRSSPLLPPLEETEVVVGSGGSRKRRSRTTPVVVQPTVGPWPRSSTTWRSTWRSSWRTSGSSVSSSATSSPAARPGSTKNCKWRPESGGVRSGSRNGGRGWGTGIREPGAGVGERGPDGEPHPLLSSGPGPSRTPPAPGCAPGRAAAAACCPPASFPLCLGGTLGAHAETLSCQTINTVCALGPHPRESRFII